MRPAGHADLRTELLQRLYLGLAFRHDLPAHGVTVYSHPPAAWKRDGTRKAIRRCPPTASPAGGRVVRSAT